MIVGQESGVALIRSTHFQPYAQVGVLSFKERFDLRCAAIRHAGPDALQSMESTERLTQ